MFLNNKNTQYTEGGKREKAVPAVLKSFRRNFFSKTLDILHKTDVQKKSDGNHTSEKREDCARFAGRVSNNNNKKK